MSILGHFWGYFEGILEVFWRCFGAILGHFGGSLEVNTKSNY